MAVTALAMLATGCSAKRAQGPAEVVVYTSVDQQLAEPILRAYESKTGVKVRPVYDTEATKTTGLASRLLAERHAPQADVFWNSEIVRTIVLERAGALAPYASPSAAEIPARYRDPRGYWTGFAARVRVIGVNPRLLSKDRWPATFDELADPKWQNRVAMAYPLFGTTSFHVAALFAEWGPPRAAAWLTQLRDHGVRIVDGNSTARDLVVAGTVPVCITDSDDIAAALAQGREIGMVVPRIDGRRVLLIPNTAALVAGAPHAQQGRAFLDYLLSREVEARLATGPGAQIPLRSGQPWPQVIPRFDLGADTAIDFADAVDRLEPATELCRRLFVR